MTALSDAIANAREWIDDSDPSDAIVTQWVRFAEERISNEMRSQEQVIRDYATMDDNCVNLPADYLELIYVRVKGGRPFNYITPDEYWKLLPQPTLIVNDPNSSTPYPSLYGVKQAYTLIGTTLFVWPPIDENQLTQVEIAYYRAIQPTGDVIDPVLVRYPSIFLNCTLAAAQPYIVEDVRLATFAGLATAAIMKVNEAATRARWSGSPLAPMVRSFG